jgi:hypothetical protein
MFNIITINKKRTHTAPKYTINKIIAKKCKLRSTKIKVVNTKTQTKNKIEYIGFVTVMTINAANTTNMEFKKNKERFVKSQNINVPLPCCRKICNDLSRKRPRISLSCR